MSQNLGFQKFSFKLCCFCKLYKRKKYFKWDFDQRFVDDNKPFLISALLLCYTWHSELCATNLRSGITRLNSQRSCTEQTGCINRMLLLLHRKAILGKTQDETDRGAQTVRKVHSSNLKILPLL